MKRNTVLYNFQKNSSFIINDRAILSNTYNVINFEFKSRNKLWTPITFINQLVFLIKHWFSYQIIISQIAGYHTFIPSLLAYLKLKKHIIILHGTECNSIPEINYGNLQKPILKWFTKISILLSDHLLPVSHSLIENNSSYYKSKYAKFGLRHNINNFNTPFTIIHNCIDDKKFTISQEERNPNTFITIALELKSERNVKLKGIDLVLNLARKKPDYEFTILGSDAIYNYNNDLKNVTLVGKVNHNELNKYYNNHKYYLQLSISESFGLSLCEAMLCGCIPIVSNAGMMPEIVQDKRLILNQPIVLELEKIITQLKHINDTLSDMERRRSLIKDRYSIENRKQKLLSVINFL